MTNTPPSTTNAQRSLGVADNPDYGNDSPLYGAMGFVRKSERAVRPYKKKEAVTSGSK